jgi:acyl carrier protein
MIIKTMTTQEFKQTFNTMLINKLSVSMEGLKPEATFKDMGANSLDMLELIMEFEYNFFITIPDEDADSFITIGDAEHYLKTKLNIT